MGVCAKCMIHFLKVDFAHIEFEIKDKCPFCDADIVNYNEEEHSDFDTLRFF